MAQAKRLMRNAAIFFGGAALLALSAYAQDNASQVARGEDQFNDFMGNMLNLLPPDLKAPEIQLVFNRVELIERIFLIEAGLNPRLIEYIKHKIYSMNRIALDSGGILFPFIE